MLSKIKKRINAQRRGFWFTTREGQHIYVDGDETPKEACARVYNEKEVNKKIASVKIDPSRDNILPELNEAALETMGLTENKKVLVKKFSLERNAREHGDVKPEDYDFIIGNALYDPDKIVKGKNERGTYFTFVKKLRVSKKDGTPVHGVVLLDVDKTKDNFEVIHWHWVREKQLRSI